MNSSLINGRPVTFQASSPTGFHASKHPGHVHTTNLTINFDQASTKQSLSHGEKGKSHILKNHKSNTAPPIFQLN